MIDHVTTAPGDHVPTADQRVVTHGVPWTHYDAHLALRGERSSPRIAYFEGALELMSPSREHERIKSYLGRLIEAHAGARGIDLSPYGSRSELFPDLDVEALTSCLDYPTVTQAVAAFRDTLR